MAARVSFDGELMHQIVPALPISGSHAFHVVRDSGPGHLLFSIGNSGQLFLLRPNGTNGQYSLLDIGARLGLAHGSVVSTLAVTQDSQLALYIVFAVAGQSDNDPSRIFVIRPTMPNEWQQLSSDLDISSWLLQGEFESNLWVTQLYLGPVRGDDMPYPLIVPFYMKLDRKVIDAVRLRVDTAANKWSFDHSFELPEDPRWLLDACCGYLPSGDHGMFCLYQVQGKTSLTFASMDSNAGNVSLQVRPDATSVATFTNPDGYTDLIVAGSRLYHYTALSCCETSPPGDPEHFTVISEDPLVSSIQQLALAQAGRELSVYCRNSQDSVLYQQFVVAPSSDADGGAVLNAQTPPVPLLSATQGGGRFAILLEETTGSQLLYIIGAGGQLTVMEQDGSTRLWQTNTVLVPSSGENSEIITFTTHAHLASADGAPLANKTVLLCGSSPINLSVNGQPTRITQDGTSVTTDSRGNLTVIHQVSDLSTVAFTIRDVPGSDPTLGASYTYDPTTKVQAKLGDLLGNDLRKATLPNGEKLIPESISNSSACDSAIKLLSQLHSRMQDLSAPSSPTSRTHTDPASKALGEAPPVTSLQANDSVLWDFWHWVTGVASDVKNWFVDAWHLVIETAGKVYRFVLSTVSHVMKAISAVFEMLKVGAEKLVHALGFLFNWSDILDTHTILVGVVNCVFDVAADGLNTFAPLVDSWFQGLEDLISNLDIPEHARGHTIDLRQSDASQNPSNDTLNTPGGNWSHYQLEHGGVGKHVLAEGTFEGDKPGSDNPLVQFWEDVVSPCLTKVGDLLKDLQDNFVALLRSFSTVTIGDLLKHLGVQLLRDLVSVIRQLAVGLLKFVAHLVHDAKGVMNASIDIPLITPLYRLITKGSNLTMLDAIALLVAVPTTVLYKTITGKKPSEIEQLSYFLSQPGPHMSNEEPSLKLSSQNASPFTQPLSLVSEPTISSLHSVNDSTGDSREGGSAVSFVAGSASNVNKLHLIAAFIYELGRAFVAPVLNGIIVCLAPFKWILPDTDVFEPGRYASTLPSKGPLPTFYTPASKWSIGIGVLVNLCSFPLDFARGHLPCDPPLRPAADVRFASWALGCINVPAAVFLRRKRALASIAALVAFAQTPLLAWSIYKDLSVPDGEYPGRDSVLVALTSAERVASLVAKITSSIASHTDGKEQVSFWLANISNAGTVGVQLAIGSVKFSHKYHHELQSLYGN